MGSPRPLNKVCLICSVEGGHISLDKETMTSDVSQGSVVECDSAEQENSFLEGSAQEVPQGLAEVKTLKRLKVILEMRYESRSYASDWF